MMTLNDRIKLMTREELEAFAIETNSKEIKTFEMLLDLFSNIQKQGSVLSGLIEEYGKADKTISGWLKEYLNNH